MNQRAERKTREKREKFPTHRDTKPRSRDDTKAPVRFVMFSTVPRWLEHAFEEQRPPLSNPAMSRVIIQALCNASARPLPRMHSFRLLAPFSTARSVSATTFSSPVVPARKASSSSSEKDFDIDDDVPLPPAPSSNKTASPAPNPYPETILDVPLTGTDWSRSYTGLSTEPFPKELADILMGPVDPMDVEIKPGSYKPQ